MTSIKELEDLRAALITNFKNEGDRLAVWDADYIASLGSGNKKEDIAPDYEFLIVKANGMLMQAQAASIGSLSAIIKQMKAEQPKGPDVASLALEEARKTLNE